MCNDMNSSLGDILKPSVNKIELNSLNNDHLIYKSA